MKINSNPCLSQLKNEANKLFGDKKYEPAIDLYTSAISYNPNVAAYFANRAFGEKNRGGRWGVFGEEEEERGLKFGPLS